LETRSTSDAGELPALLTVEAADDLSLHKDGETLIEPEVLKVGIRHQIARPAVSNFVGDYVNQRPVTSLKEKSN